MLVVTIRGVDPRVIAAVVEGRNRAARATARGRSSTGTARNMVSRELWVTSHGSQVISQG